MIKYNNKWIYKKNGITIISLVITIIILLILSGVTLNLVLGEYGLIEKTIVSREVTNVSHFKDIAESIWC